VPQRLMWIDAQFLLHSGLAARSAHSAAQHVQKLGVIEQWASQPAPTLDALILGCTNGLGNFRPDHRCAV